MRKGCDHLWREHSPRDRHTQALVACDRANSEAGTQQRSRIALTCSSIFLSAGSVRLPLRLLCVWQYSNRFPVQSHFAGIPHRVLVDDAAFLDDEVCRFGNGLDCVVY